MNHPTRICFSLLLAGGMTATSPAQEAAPLPAPEVTERSAKELDELLGPIALYPDDLVAIILPAAAQPTDIVLAARYLENDGAMDKLDEQHWDESVRALAHFPDVIEWMNKNLAWTQGVGDAFALQPAAVMQSIQRLRGKAYAAGTLRDTDQQKVLVDGNVIRIVSAKEDVIYVPRYRTEVVYVDRPVYYTEPWITFGVGWAIGSWYHWGCNWNNYTVWVYDHHDHWHNHHSYYYHGGYYNHGHNYNHGNHYNQGHAWAAPRSHARYGYHGGGSDGHRSRSTHRPGPYVENESRHRSWNRDGNSNGGNPTRNDGFTGGSRTGDRNDVNNTTTPGNGERRTREPRGDRGAPDGNRNPGVIVNNGGTPGTTTPPVVTDSRSPNGRNRDNGSNRGNNGDSGQGDGRDRSRSPRNVSPGNPTIPAVVASPGSPPPVVTSSHSRSNGRSIASVDDRPDSTQRSRRETGSNAESNRTVRAYAPARTPPPSNPPAVREARSEPSRSPAPASRRYNDSSNASNNSAPTTTASAGRYHGGGGSGGRSSTSSSDSGHSRNSGSNRSNDSGSNDGGNNGSHSGKYSSGGGRGR